MSVNVTIPACTVYANTLAEANAMAESLACNDARTKRVSMSNLPSWRCSFESFSQTVYFLGATGAFTWQLYSGAFPTGMGMTQLSSNTALFTGTPTTPGTYTFTIRVVMSPTTDFRKTFTMVIFGFVTGSDLPDGTTGTAYSQQIVADGGSGNYLFELESGALPDGLSLGPTGFITGTPTTEETGLFTVRVTDLVTPAHTCTQDFEIDVLSGCEMFTCGDKADVPLTGGENMETIAFGDDECYVLVITHDAGYSQTYFNKYDPATNTLTRKATVASYQYGDLAYHDTQKKFVYVSQDRVYVFDPVSETVSDSFATANPSSTVVYVPSLDMMYCFMGRDGGGQYYVGKVDIVARTATQLGVIPFYFFLNPFSPELVYCPLDNCLYGCFQGAAMGILQFNLTTNIGTINGGDLGAVCCWDSDRNLLLTFSNETVLDWNTATKAIDRTTVSAEDIQMAGTPIYVSSLRKAFVQGFDNDTPSGDGVIIAYDPAVPTVGKVKNDTGYTEIYPVQDGSLMAWIYNLVSNANGVKKICVT